MEIDNTALKEFREHAIRSTRLANGIAVLIGAAFITCAIYVYRYPVPATVISLVMYLGAAAVYGVLDPKTLASGWIVKIIIVVGLFKAVQLCWPTRANAKPPPPSRSHQNFPRHQPDTFHSPQAVGAQRADDFVWKKVCPATRLGMRCQPLNLSAGDAACRFQASPIAVPIVPPRLPRAGPNRRRYDRAARSIPLLIRCLLRMLCYSLSVSYTRLYCD